VFSRIYVGTGTADKKTRRDLTIYSGYRMNPLKKDAN
jgi:hypothetical protein